MLYAPWKCYEQQDAGYFAVFVLGYPFNDALRMVQHADPLILAGMADMGRYHRRACHRGLAALIDRMEEEDAKRRRMLPVVVSQDSGKGEV